MGWFALPIEAHSRFTHIPSGGQSIPNLTDSLTSKEHRQLDRQWEILSILVPNLSIHAQYRGSFQQEGGGSTEHLLRADMESVWNPEIGIAVNFNIVQSGLVVGSLPVNLSLKILAKSINLAKQTFFFDYDVTGLSFADSLQNPIVVSGAESVNAQISYNSTFQLLPNFTYEFEEAGKTVRKEISGQTEEVSVEYYYSIESEEGPAMVLYINESDREYASGEGNIRPADVPV